MFIFLRGIIGGKRRRVVREGTIRGDKGDFFGFVERCVARLLIGLLLGLLDTIVTN